MPHVLDLSVGAGIYIDQLYQAGAAIYTPPLFFVGFYSPNLFLALLVIAFSPF